MHRIAGSFLLILLFSGCSWPLDPSYTGSTSETPSEPWKPRCIKTFHPCSEPGKLITLDDLEVEVLDLATMVDVALQNSPLTKQTWAIARANAYDVSVAASNYYPQVNGSVNYAYLDVELTNPPPIPPGAATSGNVAGNLLGYNKIIQEDLNINYILWDFGHTRYTVEAARQALYASDWTNNREIQQVIINVLIAYYQFIGDRALIESKYIDLKNIKTSYEAALGLYEAGIKTKLDVLQAKTDVVTMELDIVNLEGLENIYLGQLATAMGLPANTHFDKEWIDKLSFDMPFDEVSQNVDELVEIAMERRPDLASAIATYRQSQKEVAVAWADGMPTVTMYGDFYKNNYTNMSHFNYLLKTGVVSLNIPIFAGFYYSSQLKRAQENMRAADAAVANIELSIMQEVITSYYNFKTSEKTLKLDEDFLKFSEEAYEISLAQYQEGIASILDLLLAQRNLADARSRLVNNRTRWAIALANISFNTGVLGQNQITEAKSDSSYGKKRNLIIEKIATDNITDPLSEKHQESDKDSEGNL